MKTEKKSGKTLARRFTLSPENEEEEEERKNMVSSSTSYPRPRRVGVGALGKSTTSSSSQPLSLRDVEREVEDVFETHSVAEIREVRLMILAMGSIDWFFFDVSHAAFPPFSSVFVPPPSLDGYLLISVLYLLREKREEGPAELQAGDDDWMLRHGNFFSIFDFFPFFLFSHLNLLCPYTSKIQNFRRLRPRPAPR